MTTINVNPHREALEQAITETLYRETLPREQEKRIDLAALTALTAIMALCARYEARPTAKNYALYIGWGGITYYAGKLLGTWAAKRTYFQETQNWRSLIEPIFEKLGGFSKVSERYGSDIVNDVMRAMQLMTKEQRQAVPEIARVITADEGRGELFSHYFCHFVKMTPEQRRLYIEICEELPEEDRERKLDFLKRLSFPPDFSMEKAPLVKRALKLTMAHDCPASASYLLNMYFSNFTEALCDLMDSYKGDTSLLETLNTLISYPYIYSQFSVEETIEYMRRLTALNHVVFEVPDIPPPTPRYGGGLLVHQNRSMSGAADGGLPFLLLYMSIHEPDPDFWKDLTEYLKEIPPEKRFKILDFDVLEALRLIPREKWKEASDFCAKYNLTLMYMKICVKDSDYSQFIERAAFLFEACERAVDVKDMMLSGNIFTLSDQLPLVINRFRSDAATIATRAQKLCLAEGAGFDLSQFLSDIPKKWTIKQVKLLFESVVYFSLDFKTDLIRIIGWQAYQEHEDDANIPLIVTAIENSGKKPIPVIVSRCDRILTTDSSPDEHKEGAVAILNTLKAAGLITEETPQFEKIKKYLESDEGDSEE